MMFYDVRVVRLLPHCKLEVSLAYIFSYAGETKLNYKDKNVYRMQPA